jgi:hypothetical protein
LDRNSWLIHGSPLLLFACQIQRLQRCNLQCMGIAAPDVARTQLCRLDTGIKIQAHGSFIGGAVRWRAFGTYELPPGSGLLLVNGRPSLGCRRWYSTCIRALVLAAWTSRWHVRHSTRYRLLPVSWPIWGGPGDHEHVVSVDAHEGRARYEAGDVVFKDRAH